MYKNIFIDGYKQTNVIENCKNFFKRLKKLKLYLIEFKEDDIIKPKIYFSNCAIDRNEQQSIIIIIYNEYIFFTNNRIQKV